MLASSNSQHHPGPRAHRVIDYQFEPPIPAGWTRLVTRELSAIETIETQLWCSRMTGGRWCSVLWYTPCHRQLFLFERGQDAAMFKLAWG